MSIKDLTITDQNVQSVYVQSQPDRLTGTAQQNKAVFDALPQLIIQRFNLLLDALAGTGAAGEIPVGPIEGVTAENVQQALSAIQQNLTAYIDKIKSAVGASEVGVSPISGLEASNVQAALQALRTIQSMIDQNIKKIMSEQGAATVGFSPVGGMAAQNVQQALAELRTAIDNIVAGIIPGGSITPDMIAGPIPLEKGGTGATTAQTALAVLGAGVRPNLLDNAYFVGGGTGYGTFPVNQKGVLSGNTDRQFICDRWNQFGSDWSLTKDGLVMAKRSDAAYWSFYQQIPVETLHQLVGKVVTVSVLLDSVLVTATQVLVSPVTYFPFENGERAEIYVPDDDTVGSVRYYGSATTRTVKAMKFEIGTAQTLAYQDADGAWRLLPQPESDYAAQLLRCQQYKIVYKAINSRFPAFLNGNVGYATVQTPIQMAKKPVFQLLSPDYGVLYDATAVPNGASVTEMDANSVVIQLTFPSDAGVMSANWGQCWFALDTGM